MIWAKEPSVGPNPGGMTRNVIALERKIRDYTHLEAENSHQSSIYVPQPHRLVFRARNDAATIW